MAKAMKSGFVTDVIHHSTNALTLTNVRSFEQQVRIKASPGISINAWSLVRLPPSRRRFMRPALGFSIAPLNASVLVRGRIAMTDDTQFYRFPSDGIDAMSFCSARSFPRHTHDQYGIGVVDVGCHVSHSGKGLVSAEPGNLISVNPGEVHDGRAIENQPRKWRMFYLAPELMTELRAEILDGKAASFSFAAPVMVDVALRGLFNDAFAFAALTERVPCKMACDTAILRLVARLGFHSAEGVPFRKARSCSIRRAKEKIDAEPSAPFTLVELAREVGLSRYQLIRGFAGQLGLTPHSYIVQKRLALARRILRANGSPAEAAVASGFCDQSHLARCFVKCFGLTPSGYAARFR